MSYQPRHFDQLPASRVLNRRKGVEPYVFNDDIVIAVDVALATDRPLLVSGNPGSGKTRLADAIAAVQGWNLLGKTITSRTRLESLTAEVDQLRRLNDAQARGANADLKPDACYLNPGIFWWAFQPATARWRGLLVEQAREHRVKLPYPGVERGDGQSDHAVLLIDEIDKAEPDLPNDLLEPLDRRSFDLPDGVDLGEETKINGAEGAKLLTIITTNGERELPQAFLRRCVLLDLPDPDPDRLVQIARKHFPKGKLDRIKKIAAKLHTFRIRADDLRARPPGTAEFLDAVRACEDLNIEVSDDKDSVWKKIEGSVLVKDELVRNAGI